MTHSSWLIRTLIATALCFMTSIARSETSVQFGPHPRLAISPAELAAQKAAPNFTTTRDAAVRIADERLTKPLELPAGFGGFYFDYACPDDGAFLTMKTPTEHACPTCKKIYTDERVAAAWRSTQHSEFDQALLNIAWAFAYTGDEKYAKAVKRGLLQLADEYGKYPARRDRFGNTGDKALTGGRRFPQALDEAVGVRHLARAYDLTRGSAIWTAAEAEHVERDFFSATADTLLVYSQGPTHQQAFMNSALMAIGSAIGSESLIKKSIEMPGGFRDCVASLKHEGIWAQGLMTHHVYAMSGLVDQIDFGNRIGLDLSGAPMLKTMALAPFHLAYPDGTFPAINDGDRGSLANCKAMFEWAWKRYQDPIFAQGVAWGDAKKLAELLGPDAKPAYLPSVISEDLKDAGIAVLRAGPATAKEGVCAVLDYGPHGGSYAGLHGHFDKLNLTLFAGGREWLIDSGRISYANPIYKTWVKETIAHNTVTLGGKSQAPTTGKLLWLKNSEGNAPDTWTAAAAECASAYPGTVLRRYLFLTPAALVDVYDVTTETAMQIDWAIHTAAEKITPPAGAAATKMDLGNELGYRHLTDANQWTINQPGPWRMVVGAENLPVTLLAPSATLITATGIGNRPEQKAPVLIARVNGKTARFVAIYQLPGGSEVSAASLDDAAAPTVKLSIKHSGANRAWTIRFSPDGVKVE